MYFLGSISGASGAYYNNVTGVSGIGAFSIPPSVKAIYLVPGTTGIAFALGAANGPTSFLNAVNGAPLYGASGHLAGSINGPFRVIGPNITVGIYNALGGFVSCRVFAAPTS